MKSSDKEINALKIINEHNFEYAAQFAKLMWPNSEGWKRSRAAGTGGQAKGMGMYVAAGCYLGKLRKKGLITWYSVHNSQARRFRLTALGEQRLLTHNNNAVSGNNDAG